MAAVQSTVYLGILFVLSALLPLLTIFLYRRRLLQIRLCVVEMVFLVGTVIMEAIYYFPEPSGLLRTGASQPGIQACDRSADRGAVLHFPGRAGYLPATRCLSALPTGSADSEGYHLPGT